MDLRPKCKMKTIKLNDNIEDKLDDLVQGDASLDTTNTKGMIHYRNN